LKLLCLNTTTVLQPSIATHSSAQQFALSSPPEPKNKQAFGFDLTNGAIMAFAGLWDAWKDPANGNWLQTFTIITTDANEIMAPVPNRMPVILHPGDFNRWRSREETDQPPIDLLRPFPAEEMEAFEVSNGVGNVKNNSSELLSSK
jgi:putative SOS response-associated peptidase YedK